MLLILIQDLWGKMSIPLWTTSPFHSCWSTLYSTGIVKKSLEFRIKEFEKVPKDIRDQYPIHNLTAGDDMIDAVSEHPSYVVNCILDNITRTVPLQNNFPGINTKIAS